MSTIYLEDPQDEISIQRIINEMNKRYKRKKIKRVLRDDLDLESILIRILLDNFVDLLNKVASIMNKYKIPIRVTSLKSNIPNNLAYAILLKHNLI